MSYFFPNIDIDTYTLLYKIILGVFLIFGSIVLRIAINNNKLYLVKDQSLLIIFTSILILFFGTRNIHIGTDTINYYNFYFLNGIQINGIEPFFSRFQTDLLFEVIMFLTFPFRSFTFFTFVVALIMNVSLLVLVSKFTAKGNDGSALILLLTFASAFSFMQLESNIIRNGLSIPFFLLGLYYTLENNSKKGIYFFILSLFFHSTTLLPIAIFGLVLLLKKIPIKYFVLMYLLGILLSFLGFGFHSLTFLQEVNSEDFKRLIFEGDTKYRIGFRLDFVLYNTFFLLLFLKFKTEKNKAENILIRYYIISSIVFFLNFQIPFSDRIGVYSWIVIPILLFLVAKNSFKEKQHLVSSAAASLYFIINYIILFP